MSDLVRRQDLPPPGGYQRIEWTRQPPKQFFKGTTLLFGLVASTAIAGYLVKLTQKKMKMEELEMRSALLATYPLLVAERDREHLKTLYRSREAERNLMKDVEGWKVGTWYGEPIYKTIKKDEWLDPILEEYYAHVDYNEKDYMGNFPHYF